MNRSDILSNRNDLVEGTFCYELFELGVFDEKLFFELTAGINAYLSGEEQNHRKPDREIIDFLSWFIMGVMNCVIFHNNVGDSYKIKEFDMNLWYEKYEDEIRRILNRILGLI